MQSIHYRTALGTVLMCLLFTGCSDHEEHPAGIRLIMLLDQSASIDATQRAAWAGEAIGLTTLLSAGSSITIYPIHDRTLEAAPLFDADIPFSDGQTSDSAKSSHLALLRARDGAQKAIEKGLADGRASTTDVFSALDRLGVDSRGRNTTIVFFSDMLNSTSEFNMERRAGVTQDTIAAKIAALARNHRWRSDQLAGTKVLCVLNAIRSGQPEPPVDRRTQKDFYTTLFNAMGAELLSYDTHLSGSILELHAQGGNNAASN